MEFSNGLGDKAIQDVMQTYPEIGEILARYDIGCTTCKVGICLLKDVVSIHGLVQGRRSENRTGNQRTFSEKRRMNHGKSGMWLPRQHGKGNRKTGKRRINTT